MSLVGSNWLELFLLWNAEAEFDPLRLDPWKKVKILPKIARESVQNWTRVFVNRECVKAVVFDFLCVFCAIVRPDDCVANLLPLIELCFGHENNNNNNNILTSNAIRYFQTGSSKLFINTRQMIEIFVYAQCWQLEMWPLASFCLFFFFSQR